MSLLVTHGACVAHSPDWPPAMPSPAPHARGPGSSSGSAIWPASASGSPLCSPCGRPVSSSTAGAAHCAGPGETIAGSSDTCVVFASSSAGILQPLMMPTPARELDVRKRRAEENEETFIGSFWKKTPPKKTAVSRRWNDYTFRSVMAVRLSYFIELNPDRGSGRRYSRIGRYVPTSAAPETHHLNRPRKSRTALFAHLQPSDPARAGVAACRPWLELVWAIAAGGWAVASGAWA